MVTGHYTTNYTKEAAAEDGNWPLHYTLHTTLQKLKMVTGHYTTHYTTETEAEDGNWPLHYKLH